MFGVEAMLHYGQGMVIFYLMFGFGENPEYWRAEMGHSDQRRSTIFVLQDKSYKIK